MQCDVLLHKQCFNQQLQRELAGMLRLCLHHQNADGQLQLPQ
jgi:hypothetical protein